MAILTLSEYEVQKQAPKPGRDIVVSPPAVVQQLIEHVLMYPDNIAIRYHNGTYNLELNGTVREIEIENGTVKTRNEEEKQALMRDGFIFVKSREVNDGE